MQHILNDRLPKILTRVIVVPFRTDINGLRAIAVLAVVIFHFDPELLPGGFTGVDIFFVISGFLMTRIIFNGFDNNTFSLGQFYKARANRIIPALAILCLTTLVIGWFYLTPSDYNTLSNDALNSIIFISNFFYGGDAGYFDTTSKERWLLHTWSLSAEWQFYIIYPLILVGLKKVFSLNQLKLTIIIGAIFSLMYSVYSTIQTPELAYYLLPSRAWEMMLGGIAFLFPLQYLSTKNKARLEIVGISLIIVAYLFISKNNPWPGYLALIPVLGTFCILQANRQNSIITDNPIFKKLGTWSYSIYLWHWPLSVLGIYLSLGTEWFYIGILLSILLGFLSYRYIEQYNFNYIKLSRKNFLTYKPLLIVLTVVIVAVLAKENCSKEYRLPEPLITFMERSVYQSKPPECRGSWDKEMPECVYGKGKLGAIVIGDSHASAMVSMINRATPNQSVLDWTMDACSTINGFYEISMGSKNTACGDFINYALKQAKTKYPDVPIIIINRTSQNLYGRNEKPDSAPKRFVNTEFDERNDAYRQSLATGMIETACAFAESNPVYTVRPIPELITDVYNEKMRDLMIGDITKRVSISLEEYHDRQKLAWQIQDTMAEQCGVTLIDPIPYLCDENACYGDNNGMILYSDDDHLNEDGSQRIMPAFKPIWG